MSTGTKPTLEGTGRISDVSLGELREMAGKKKIVIKKLNSSNSQIVTPKKQINGEESGVQNRSVDSSVQTPKAQTGELSKSPQGMTYRDLLSTDPLDLSKSDKACLETLFIEVSQKVNRMSSDIDTENDQLIAQAKEVKAKLVNSVVSRIEQSFRDLESRVNQYSNNRASRVHTLAKELESCQSNSDDQVALKEIWQGDLVDGQNSLRKKMVFEASGLLSDLELSVKMVAVARVVEEIQSQGVQSDCFEEILQSKKTQIEKDLQKIPLVESVNEYFMSEGRDSTLKMILSKKESKQSDFNEVKLILGDNTIDPTIKQKIRLIIQGSNSQSANLKDNVEETLTRSSESQSKNDNIKVRERKSYISNENLHIRFKDSDSKNIESISLFLKSYIGYGNEFYFIFDDIRDKVLLYEVPNISIVKVILMDAKDMRHMDFFKNPEIEVPVILLVSFLDLKTQGILCGVIRSNSIEIRKNIKITDDKIIKDVHLLNDQESIILQTTQSNLILASLNSKSQTKDFDTFFNHGTEIKEIVFSESMNIFLTFTSDNNISFFELRKDGEGVYFDFMRVKIINYSNELSNFFEIGNRFLACDIDGSLLEIQVRQTEGPLETKINFHKSVVPHVNKIVKIHSEDEGVGCEIVLLCDDESKILLYDIGTDVVREYSLPELALRDKDADQQVLAFKKMNVLHLVIADGKSSKELSIIL